MPLAGFGAVGIGWDPVGPCFPSFGPLGCSSLSGACGARVRG